MNTFFDPTKGDNFQTDKALAAIKQGGLKGQGMGEGILKESVPEAHTDYIIAVITEEFGSIISIIVITIFLYISYKIIKNCFKTSDENSKIALCGLSSLLIFQTFIHVGVNTSLLPTTGMTLPFLSYGGSSLIGSSILAGVILNFTKKDLRMNDLKKDIIIATGGTGGHIFPAVSLADFLNNNGFKTIITTDKRGFKFIDDKYIHKTIIINSSALSKKNILISVCKVIFAIFYSLFFLIKNKPKFIFGMGGYASFPVCFAGMILRIPFVIYENNLLIGKANRYLAPFAKKIFVSYKEIQGISIKYKNKITVIGNILRENILNYSKTNKDEISNKLNILVLGGSQAAKIFAEKLPDIFIKCKKNNINLKIYQQCLSEQKFDLQKNMMIII